MQSKYNQLAKLQALLDSGVLSQEEFDAAKRRILEGVDSLPQQGQMKPPPFSFEKPQPSPNKHLKWIIFGVIGAVVVIVGVVIAVLSLYSGSSEPMDSYDSSEQMPTDTLAYAYDNQEETNNGLSLFNPWRKDYFTNEWDEPDTSKPKLYTNIGESYWGILIEYIPPTSETPLEVFRFWITEKGKITDAYGPIEILVRGSDGETKRIEVSDIEDYPAYIIEPATVNALKYYLDHERFDIRINFGIWNERHSAKGEWMADPGSLQEAIDKLL